LNMVVLLTLLSRFRHFARSSDDAAADFNKQGRKIFFKTNAT
jgi:hypothetical protein